MQTSDLMGNSCESLAAMVGTSFDGLLGTDILGQFDFEISLARWDADAVGGAARNAGWPAGGVAAGRAVVECEVEGSRCVSSSIPVRRCRT